MNYAFRKITLILNVDEFLFKYEYNFSSVTFTKVFFFFYFLVIFSCTFGYDSITSFIYSSNSSSMTSKDLRPFIYYGQVPNKNDE